MIKTIFPRNHNNFKRIFKCVCAVAIIAFILGGSAGKNYSSPRTDQALTAWQIYKMEHSSGQAYAEWYCKEAIINDSRREKKAMPEEYAEESRRQDIPKLEQNRLATRNGNKKVRRRKKRGRKFSGSHYRANLFKLSKILDEISQQKNGSKKAEGDSRQKNEGKYTLGQAQPKQKSYKAMITMTVLIGVILVISTVAAAEALSVLDNSPVVAMGSILPVVAIKSPQNAGDIDQRAQYSDEILPPNIELFRERPKISIDQQLILYQKLYKNSEITSKKLLAIACEIKIEISLSQLNRIRKEWGLSRRKGRPCRSEAAKEEQPLITNALQANAGVKFFSLYLEENDKYYEPVMAIHIAIALYKSVCEEDDFRLLHSRSETIEKKWKALAILSLLGIKRLSQLDYHEHSLGSILGYDYSYSTLFQFLGELERIDSGYFLNIALAIDAKGDYCYIDTHKIAYWSRKKMHKGRITGNGRVMAGTCTVIAQDQYAQTIAVENHPPDTHLTHVIRDYCAHIVELTGISTFVIDREVNSAKMARLFVGKGWNLICLLSANDYNGLSDFRRYFSIELEDGTRLFKATWKEYRKGDPRKFVIVQKQHEVIVYWGTQGIVDRLTAKQLVSIYRNRTEIQENTIKDMKNHGALDINYGRRTISGPDRTHQRKIDKIDGRIDKQKVRLSKAQQDIVEQDRKVTQSILRGHRSLLWTRQNKLQQYQQKEQKIKNQLESVEKEKKDLGTPGERKDRDLRKQHIMTCRTAWLENQLKKFTALLSKSLEQPADIETILALFFNRSAIEVETQDMILYKFNSQGLSPKFQIVLHKIIEGFNRISLSHRGKKVFAELVGFP